VRLLRCAAALLMAIVQSGSSLGEQSDAARVERDGVILEIQTLADRVVFCVSAREGIKISAQYGVTIDAYGRDKNVWNERLPKIITGDGWDFNLPLRIELNTRGSAAAGRVNIRLGACSDHCDLVVFDVRVPLGASSSAEGGICK
jgi:hypothetical protein